MGRMIIQKRESWASGDQRIAQAFDPVGGFRMFAAVAADSGTDRFD
jgi:hypothetical protein